MDESILLIFILYVLWIGICTSNFFVAKIIRWTLIIGFVLTPLKVMGIDIAFKCIAFVIIFAPVIIKGIISILKIYKEV